MSQQPMIGMPQQQIIGMPPERGSNSTVSKYIFVKFLIKFKVKDFGGDPIFQIRGNNDISIEIIIKCFKILLCDDTIKIDKYILEPTNIELDPLSTETLISKGINELTTIVVIDNYKNN